MFLAFCAIYALMMVVTSILVHFQRDFRSPYYRDTYRFEPGERNMLAIIWWLTLPVWLCYQLVKLFTWAAGIED